MSPPLTRSNYKLLFVNGGDTRNLAVFECSGVHGSSTCSRNVRSQKLAVMHVTKIVQFDWYGVCLKVSGTRNIEHAALYSVQVS